MVGGEADEAGVRVSASLLGVEVYGAGGGGAR